VGATALYSCEEGFYITGESEIVCDDDNGVVDWSGELPECRKLGKEILITLCFLNRCFQCKICHNIKIVNDCIFPMHKQYIALYNFVAIFHQS